MAQVVKLEPGDILVLANVGYQAYEDLEHLLTLSRRIRQATGLERVVVFPGDVDVSKIPAEVLAEAQAGRTAADDAVAGP
ncbi:hypothetical protein ACIOC2_01500 [Streptomyces sp. NPDC088337]|uniref:hypothetical protein n=1 Tax=unclassified Streptomyces TaxID=2593676 RepID=UPI0038119343